MKKFLDEGKPEEKDGVDGSSEAMPLNPLIIKLSEEEEELLAEIIKEDYRNGTEARKAETFGTAADGSTVDFDGKFAELYELYEGADKARPEKWMCGRSLKIAQAIVEMMVARLMPAVWNDTIVHWSPVEATDKKRAKATSDLMRWVLNVWMKIDKDVEEIVRGTAMMGTAWVETFWSVVKRDLDQVEEVSLIDENGVQILGDDGAPMTLENRMLSIDERPAIRVIPITKLITQPGCTDIQKEPIIKLEDFYFHELEDMERAGIAYNVSSDVTEHVNKILEDKLGESMEQAEQIATVSAQRRMELVECGVWYGPYDTDKDGFAEEICVLWAIQANTILRIYKTCKISRTGKRPITGIPFVKRLYKLLGIGLLEQVRPLAEEIDACFWQLQDANTLSVMRWGFYDPNSDYSPAEHVIKPRAMYPVTNPSQNVYFPDVNIPIERILAAVRLIMEFTERLTAASSYMMGKESDIVGGSGTATRTATIQSSANIRFNLPASNIKRGLAEVMRDILNLCFLNAPDGLEKRILGEGGEAIFQSSKDVQDAFSLEMDCYLDPNSTMGNVDMERELAVLLYDKMVMGGNPFVVQSPEKLWHATANLLEAHEQDPVKWIGRMGTSKDTNDPEEENTMFRQGQIVGAEPQENHLEHIMVHTRVFESGSPDVLLWPKEMLEALRYHIEEHKRLLMSVMQFQGGKHGGGAGVPQPGEEGGVPGRPEALAGQLGVQSSANPAAASAENQAIGSALGTATAA